MEKENFLQLERLFRKYYPHLVLYARKFLVSDGAAEDVVQDLFLHLYETSKLQKATPAYLFTSVRNASLNYLSSATIRTCSLGFEEEQITDNDLDERLIYMDKLERLDRAIQTLPVKCRQVFTMVYLEGMHYEEVADKLNISYHTVKAHMTNAFKLLRGKMLVLLFHFWKLKIFEKKL